MMLSKELLVSMSHQLLLGVSFEKLKKVLRLGDKRGLTNMGPSIFKEVE